MKVDPGATGGDRSLDTYRWAYQGFAPAEEGRREALTSVGNGYLCTRGAAEWQDADDVHYPGTYVHGVYDRATSVVGGRLTTHEDLVNLPRGLVLQLRIEDDPPLRLADVDVLAYTHELDLRHATLHRRLRIRDRAGRVTRLHSRRFVSMADVHIAGIEWTLEPEGWSGRVQVVSALDGRVVNANVARYAELARHHLSPVSARVRGDVIALETVTRGSGIVIAEAARTRALRGGAVLEVARTSHREPGHIAQVLAFDVRAGVATRVEKVVAVSTSRDPGGGGTVDAAVGSVARHVDLGAAWPRHAAAWHALWQRCDLRVAGDDEVQRLLHLHTSHLLQVCSPHTADLDAGVPARGLGGEAYRGHVFWDELYVIPYLSLRMPEVARGLLMYRCRRLPAARALAAAAGHRGAMFPWQSGSEGTEETPEVHLNPRSGRWDEDHSHRQRHVGVAIFYEVWHHVRATDDQAFLHDHGAEVLLEIALFWSSIAHLDPTRGRYEIHGVMGPDEFHERQPGLDGGGLRNNAYTNVMVAWLCGVAGEVLALLPPDRARDLRRRIGLSDDDIDRWEDMSRRMFVPFHDGVISQFEGYEDLPELDWEAYRARYGDIARLDRILRAEGDAPDRYRLSKQADAVMLPFLFTEDELHGILARLGYDPAPDLVRRTIEHYDRRTSHGSTLSSMTHAAALADIDLEQSWERFRAALRSDVDDVQGGTTQEGIHLGVMAGTLDLVQSRYAGVRAGDGTLHVSPRLPGDLDEVAFPLQHRGTRLHLAVRRDRVTASVDGDAARPVRIEVDGEARTLGPGDEASWDVTSRRTP